MKKAKESIELAVERLIASIPVGHKSTLKRDKNKETIDRHLRDSINLLNKSGTACIVNVGKGYFRVDKHDPIDSMEARKYIIKERSRAYDILHKCKAMENYLDMQDQLSFEEWLNQTDGNEGKDGT